MKKLLPVKSKIIIAVFLPTLIFCFFSRDACAQRTKPKEIQKTPLKRIQKAAPKEAISKPPEEAPKPIARISADFDKDVFEILVLINQERAKFGLSQMVLDDDVSDIARDYSKRMAKENFFAHVDADGDSVLERAKAAHLKHWSKIGENLFSVVGASSFAAFAVKNWMKSLTHRQNILDKDWTTTGIGVAESKDGEIFITQVFIKR